MQSISLGFASNENVLSALARGLVPYLKEHLPSQHRLFVEWATLERSVLDPRKLGEFYLNYQAGMHATRVMVYFLPYLNSPTLRQIKLKIFVDDDGLPNGGTHHYQLSRAFRNIGACLPIPDEEFGDIAALIPKVTPETARFVQSVQGLYPQNLGAWAVAELLSDDWMHALAERLSRFYPSIASEPYFKDCFDGKVEEEHGRVALALAELTVKENPKLLEETIQSGKTMAKELDLFWEGLYRLLLER